MGSTHRRGWSSPLTATSIGRDQAAEAGTRSSGWAMTAATHTMPARRPHFSLTKGLAHRAGQVKGMKNCCFVDFGEERERAATLVLLLVNLIFNSRESLCAVLARTGSVEERWGNSLEAEGAAVQWIDKGWSLPQPARAGRPASST